MPETSPASSNVNQYLSLQLEPVEISAPVIKRGTNDISLPITEGIRGLLEASACQQRAGGGGWCWVTFSSHLCSPHPSSSIRALPEGQLVEVGRSPQSDSGFWDVSEKSEGGLEDEP